MIYCYPSVNGSKERHTFYETWSEVPITAFVQWQKLAKKIEPIETRMQPIYNKIVSLADKKATAIYQKNIHIATKADEQLRKLEKKIMPLQLKHDSIVVEMVGCFTSVPKETLAQMPHDDGSIDNSFVTYKNRLAMLVAQPLPDDAISEFEFQTKTDKEIDGIKQQYIQLSWFGKRSKKGRKLWKQYKAAKNSTYKIENIWLQTTLANKYFQDQANTIVEEMNKGNYENLPYLVAILVNECSQDKQALEDIRNGKDGKAYMERYKARFLELVKYRINVFTEQQRKFDVATLKRVANFFLRNCEI